MKHYGLIGKSLEHSFSKTWFSKKFEKENLKAEYHNLECPDIQAIVDLLANSKFSGLNVTIPYKEQVMPLLDAVDAEAREIGAVNTIAFQNGKTLGFNTDVFGFHQSIKPFLTSQHERVLILGTGGASKAVAWVLRKIGLEVRFVSRQPSAGVLSYEEVNAYVLRYFRLIVNTTPLGTFPETEQAPAIPYEFLTPDHLLYDLIYNPAETRFLQQGRLKGAATINGLDMLQQQAERSWEIWNSKI